MVAAPGFEAEDARRFVELARARPGHFTFGSGGAGTSEHLAAELLKARTGTDLVHVPYRGGAPALVDLQAGRISMMFSNLSMVLPHVQAGRLKALGIADAQRSPALPDVPTLSEQGIDEVNVTVWWGLMGPAGMPEEIVARLSGALSDALGSAGMRQSLEGMNAQIRPGTPAEFAQFLEREGARWGEVIRAAGIRAD